MSTDFAITAIRASGHEVSDSLAQPGRKWFVRFKGEIHPTAAYETRLREIARECLEKRGVPPSGEE